MHVFASTTYAWSCDLDNYSPVRATASGTLRRGVHPSGHDVIVIDLPDVRQIDCGGRGAVYLIDDGASVTVWYVAGWNPHDPGLILNPFPTNPDGATRPDNGRVIDYSSWRQGPKLAYHLKVTRTDTGG